VNLRSAMRSDDESEPDELLCGNISKNYEEGHKRQLTVFVCSPLANSRWLLGGWWMVVWAVPFFLAGCGFLLQNFQLRIGTYHYVHKMLEYDLVRSPTAPTINSTNYTSNLSKLLAATHYIPLTVGETPQNVSFGSLDDPMTATLGEYQEVKISALDMLAALFPFFFMVLVVSMDQPFVLTRIMLCFFVLAVGKGFFAWITIVPDSNGWKACQARLDHSIYPVEWYAQERQIHELLLMDPRSRLCADMMWSGHTYFVAIFAFGLHECVRRAMRGCDAWKRILVESLVASAAILQQTVEIYFVLKSRFHYTSDVVMAVFVTYLLYTNSVIAVLAAWWVDPGKFGREKLLAELSENKFQTGSKWLRNGLHSDGNISLGCCCCASSRQWIYGPADIQSIVNDIEEATFVLPEGHQLKMDADTKQLLLDSMGLLHKRSILTETEEDEE